MWIRSVLSNNSRQHCSTGEYKMCPQYEYILRTKKLFKQNLKEHHCKTKYPGRSVRIQYLHCTRNQPAGAWWAPQAKEILQGTTLLDGGSVGIVHATSSTSAATPGSEASSNRPCNFFQTTETMFFTKSEECLLRPLIQDLLRVFHFVRWRSQSNSSPIEWLYSVFRVYSLFAFFGGGDLLRFPLTSKYQILLCDCEPRLSDRWQCHRSAKPNRTLYL